MDIAWIRGALADRRLAIVAEGTGLSVPTVRAVRDGAGNQTMATIKKIEAYLKGEK